jgi:glycosyltransferase involved in cell wall biosynthesis
MRLLFVHERKGAFGGAEANVLITATELQARGHTVALAHGPGTGRGEAEWETVFGDRFPLATDAAADGGAVLARALAEFRPEVVFVHKMSGAGVLRALAEGGCPVVRMVHDHDLCCMRSYKYNPLSRRICTRPVSLFCVFPCGASVCRGAGGGFSVRWVSYRAKRREIALNRKFARLIVASDYMREELLRNGFTADQIEIHAPVPRAASATDAATFADRNRIVYAGQIVRGKGVDVLLESLARVTAPFECVIIGDGSHRATCERLRDRLGLQGRVRFTGFLPQAQIAEHYRDASLALMSSVWPEPFGASGLEAMRCGLPVVAFDAGGIREWLLHGVNGFLVPWMDRDTYAAQVDALLRDKPLARRLGENGRRIAGERFNFAAYVGGLENLFLRAAQEAAAAPNPPRRPAIPSPSAHA